jgi:hypothetical protein
LLDANRNRRGYLRKFTIEWLASFFLERAARARGGAKRTGAIGPVSRRWSLIQNCTHGVLRIAWERGHSRHECGVGSWIRDERSLHVGQESRDVFQFGDYVRQLWALDRHSSIKGLGDGRRKQVRHRGCRYAACGGDISWHRLVFFLFLFLYVGELLHHVSSDRAP